MKQRWSTLLVVIAIVPLIVGAGGFNPPPPGFKITGPAVSAVIVIDAHDAASGSTKAGQGAIYVQKGTATAGAVFTTPAASQLFGLYGCDATKTELRFLNVTLTQWIPEAIVAHLMDDLGIFVSDANAPIITDIDGAVCTYDPTNASTATAPGTLSFQALIQFLVPSPNGK